MTNDRAALQETKRAGMFLHDCSIVSSYLERENGRILLARCDGGIELFSEPP